MRLVALACALIVVTCVAVFNAILSQRASVPVAAPAPANEKAVRAVITTIDEQEASPPVAMTTGKASNAAPPIPLAPASAAPPLPVAAAVPAAPVTLAPGLPAGSNFTVTWLPQVGQKPRRSLGERRRLLLFAVGVERRPSMMVAHQARAVLEALVPAAVI